MRHRTEKRVHKKKTERTHSKKFSVRISGTMKEKTSSERAERELVQKEDRGHVL